jgi:diadenosine tetraphosphate (Ap4A) HIT family hydrolase
MRLVTEEVICAARPRLKQLKVIPENINRLHDLAGEPADKLRNIILPGFICQHDLNAETKGLRLVIGIEPASPALRIDLFAGDGSRGVPAQNPQDWILPTTNPWQRFSPGRISFLDRCAEAALRELPALPSEFGGNQLLFPLGNSAVFAVMDGDPKAPVHFLVLASEPYGNMADDNFTAELWGAFFQAAARVLSEKADNCYARLVANFGGGFQVGPRVHLHVMASPEPFPSLFPADYGFIENQDGSISAPAGSQKHEEAIALLQSRKAATDRNEKSRLDGGIFAVLKELRQQ